MKRLYRLTPHFHLSGNPLFDFEAGRIRRAASAKTLIDYSIRLTVIVCFVLLLIWLLLELTNRSSWLYFGAGIDFLHLLLALSLLASLVLDFFSMSNAFGSISTEITAGRWELLRLTTIPSKQIVAAKYGTAQLRAWRTMTLVIAVRLAVLLIFVLTIANLIVQYPNTLNTGAPLFLILALAVACVAVAGVFLIEPFWRMRAVTALGIAISTRVRQPVSGILVAVGTVAAFWLVQGMVAGALLLGATLFFAPLSLLEVAITQTVFWSPLLFLVIAAVTLYGFYSVIQTWAIRRAERFAARRD
ncbi:MAG: hypothetical protein ABI835_03790 [Chloroflexota bacterium]